MKKPVALLLIAFALLLVVRTAWTQSEMNTSSPAETIRFCLERIKESQYQAATELFSESLKFNCSQQRLRETVEEIKNSDVFEPGDAWHKRRQGDRPKAGSIRSFEPPKKIEHPGGELWESTLHFENGVVVQTRFAVDSDGKIAAIQLESVPEKPRSDHADRIFNGPEIGRRLGFDHSIRIEFFDVDARPLEWEQYVNLGSMNTTLYRQIESAPEKSYSHWVDADGSHWDSFGQYGDYQPDDFRCWKGNVYSVEALPEGVYRLAVSAISPKKPELKPGIALTPPIRLGTEQKNAKITQRLISGGTVRYHVVDAATEAPIPRAQLNEKSWNGTRLPVRANFEWKQTGDSFIRNLLPGRHVFEPYAHNYNPEEPVYEPKQKEYEIEIKDGDSTTITAKLKGRPHTPEELDKRWPYTITGTVRDLDGNPLSHAEIELMGYSGHRPGRQTTTADENGRYSIRFSMNSITAMWGTGNEKPTPEKPETLLMSIGVKRSGFVWKGARNSKGEIVSDKFLSKNEQTGVWSRNDTHSMTCYTPKPSGKHDAETSVYPLEPKTVDIVMQPSVQIRGVVQFDEKPEGPKENDRWNWQYVQTVLDLKRAERASWQPTFSGKLDDNLIFDTNTPPMDIDAFLEVSCRRPESWKDDKVVTRTDYFRLPKAGRYDAVLRWKTEERNGIRRHRVLIDSLTDADGNKVELTYTKPSQPTDYLFNHWTVRGTVRDDLGEPVEGAEVKFYRHDGWKPRLTETLTTDAEGRYAIRIKPANRQTDELAHNGEFYIVRAEKAGFLQASPDREFLLFLADEEKPEQKFHSIRSISTDKIVPALVEQTQDVTLNRNPAVEGVLRDDDGKMLPGFKLALNSEMKIDDDWRKELKLDFDHFQTGRDGKFRIEKCPTKTPYWFRLLSDPGENDIFVTNNVVFRPGETYHVDLRFHKTPDASARLMIDAVRDAEGKDITAETVIETARTKPFLPDAETERGREILRKTAAAIRPMYSIDTKKIESLQYSFYLGDEKTEQLVEPFRGQRQNRSMGITWHDPLCRLEYDPKYVRFRAIESNDDEIRLVTNMQSSYHVGNGVEKRWAGYVSGSYSETEFVLDAKTYLPKRVKSSRTEAVFDDWTPFGDPKDGQFVPLRVQCRAGDMDFDFRFKVHEGEVWLFDRSVRPEGETETVVCRIDDVRINRPVWASEAEENKVRTALRQFKDVNEYWLQWYPKDLPEFGYTFHMRGKEDRVLDWKAIKAADNWYAEFYRKGISYIGVSRLLVIDIDGLHCRRVVEHPEGLLEFDFVLSSDWMNAVGNGISETWLGWFNGTVGEGTAVLDTKTGTLREIRTKSYDEKYENYFEFKPGRFVPRQIIVNYHRDKRDAEPDMYFDFRFKVYEPCLWLFDKSVEPKSEAPPVWVSDVLVEGKPAVEMQRETNRE